MNTKDFIIKNRHEDVRRLALQASKYPDVDMNFALNQISGWQIARTKLPAWAENDDMIYPLHISMEQCSSEETARYKSKLVCHSCPDGKDDSPHTFVDLTGGFGVDFSYMCREFSEAVYVERQEHLCEIAEHNFEVLGLHHTKVVCGDGVEYLKTMKPCGFIYLDPARRDDSGGRTYAIEDCTPNVRELNDILLEKARRVMIKLSPMLDWRKAISDLHGVSEVHIVSVKNECKELLLVLEHDVKEVKVFCVNDGEEEAFTYGEHFDEPLADAITEGCILCEPNASLMKAGCFGLLSARYGVKKIAPHSNLFISDKTVDFPGRTFVVEAISTMNKKELKAFLANIRQANVAVRNFPLTAEELRKRLKLKDGGDKYVFGTTDKSGLHLLILCFRPIPSYDVRSSVVR